MSYKESPRNYLVSIPKANFAIPEHIHQRQSQSNRFTVSQDTVPGKLR